MFRVNKDDYNTVQFVPDYESEDTSGLILGEPVEDDAYEEPKAEKRKLPPVLILLIIILICGAAAAAAAFFFGSGSDSDSSGNAEAFKAALEAADYEECRNIISHNKDDEELITAVKETMLPDVNAILDNFKAGQIALADAEYQLSDINKVTAGVLHTEISEAKETAGKIDEAYMNLISTEDLIRHRKYDDVFDALIQADKDADSYDLNLGVMITEILTNNYYTLKNYLFNRYTREITSGDWDHDYIDNTAGLIEKYIGDDEDFTEFKDLLKKAEAGEITAGTATRKAEDLAAAAARDAKSGREVEITKKQSSSDSAGEAADDSADTADKAEKNDSSSTR